MPYSGSCNGYRYTHVHGLYISVSLFHLFYIPRILHVPTRYAQDYKKVINKVIREKNNIKNLLLDYIRYKQLKWYGHLRRMNEERLPKNILEWYPSGRRMGRPRYSWMQEVTTGIREERINNME